MKSGAVLAKARVRKVLREEKKAKKRTVSLVVICCPREQEISQSTH